MQLRPLTLGIAFLTLLPSCSQAGRYAVEPTDITVNGGGFGFKWCDSGHLLIAPRTVGTARHPLLRFDVVSKARVEPSLKDEQGNDLLVSSNFCDGDRVSSWGRGEANTRYRKLYIGNTGEAGKVVATLINGGILSAKGKYVLGNTPRISTDAGYAVESRCSSYSDGEYRVICLDFWSRRVWPLSKFILMQYTWQEYISVEGPNGRRKQVKNQEPLRKLSDGKSAHFTVFVRDLEGNFFANLSDGAQVATSKLEIAFDPNERYAFSPCKAFDGFDGGYDGVCRYLIDGKAHVWERVFTFDMARKVKTEVAYINVDADGDVYFALGHSPLKARGIWKYSAATEKFEQITSVEGLKDEWPRLSPDGKRIAFIRGDKLFVAVSKGE